MGSEEPYLVPGEWPLLYVGVVYTDVDMYYRDL
jgi:hypothetical protein